MNFCLQHQVTDCFKSISGFIFPNAYDFLFDILAIPIKLKGIQSLVSVLHLNKLYRQNDAQYLGGLLAHERHVGIECQIEKK